MLLRSITLKNVRCFSGDATVDLTHGRADDQPHKWVVVFGGNGTGKSTFLRAIGMALTGQPALNHLLPDAEGLVRANEKHAEVSVVFSDGPHDVSTGRPRKTPRTLSWLLVGDEAVELEDGDQTRLVAAHSIVLDERGSQQRKGDARLFLTQIATDDPQRGWLLCGYGPHRRLSGASSELASQVPALGRAARLVTLFHEKAALTSAERWLQNLDHRASVGQQREKRNLELVKKVLDSELLHEGVSLREVSPDGVFFDTPYKAKVAMADLSDGYRTTLAFLLDMLQHIAHAFDLADVIGESNEHAVITAEGVVLIDEIDSHLHPEWQRTLPRWLHSRFPNVQFVVATHSPLIPTCVAEGEGLVVRLQRVEEEGQSVIQPTLDLGRMGLTADQNLTGPNFGLRTTRDVMTEELEGEIQRLRAKVRSNQASDEERAALTQLQFKFMEIAPAAPTYDDVAAWERDTKALQSAGEE
ncbi:MAG: AAA family ATPase [Planctomycetota bacterium]